MSAKNAITPPIQRRIAMRLTKFAKKMRMTGFPFFSVMTFLPCIRHTSSTSSVDNPLILVFIAWQTSLTASF